MYGDGSHGALNVTSGTTNLALNTWHKFTTVNVSSGATLSTASTTGSVLYISATTSINISGTIDVSNKVDYGDESWSVVIDGVTYTSPGVGAGGDGDNNLISPTSLQYKGFGGGGRGYNGGSYYGGAGATATGSDPDGGNAYTTTRSTVGATNGKNDGAHGGGGSGGSYSYIASLSGGASVTVVATSGEGGETFGANGGSGTTGFSWNGIGSVSYASSAGGGGGSGGQAGRAGVHVVLRSPVITVNGTVITSGTNGQNGGNGGQSRNQAGPTNGYGYGGGGGGGGNGGDVLIGYATSLTDTGTYTMTAGTAGTGGIGGWVQGSSASNGTAGASGSKTANPIIPTANFTVVSTTVTRGVPVTFTNTSLGATSYAWDFDDGNTSTSTSPSNTFATTGTFTVELTATNTAGSGTKTMVITSVPNTLTRSASASMSLGSTATRTAYFERLADASMSMGSSASYITIKNTGALGNKKYLYKVYDEDGIYIETWGNDVTDDPEFTQEINTLGSDMTVVLARNSDSLAQSSEALQAEDGTSLLDEGSIALTASVETRTQVGEGSSVKHNNRVDVYAYYGSIETLQTESGEPITTEDGAELQTEVGYPNGVRIFTGFISDINIRYGGEESTVVKLSSFGYDLMQFPLMSGTDTTVPYLSDDPSDIAKDIMDKFMAETEDYSLYTNRTSVSIEDTATVVSYTFKNNTYAEALDKVLELMPSNWYYFVGLGDNTVYFREKSTTPQHLFYLGKHILMLDLKSSTLATTNDVIFTGGGDPALFERYTETRATGTRRTLERYSDNRVTLSTSAEIISEGIIARKNMRQYRSTVEIASKVYDIESINVGDVVGFRNFDNEVDLLTMQVVGRNYASDVVRLQLDTLPPSVNKRLEDIQRNLKVTENAGIPDAPS